MRVTLLALSLLVAAPALADEGMWTFDNFPADQTRERHGFAPDAAWLDHVRLSAARSASCSASFVSGDGLVMTNHHCARDCVEDVSTAERDLVSGGFLAATRAAELRCPDERVDQLTAIRDVTARVRAAAAGKTGEGFTAALDAETGRLVAECQRDARTFCQVVSLYRGGLYHLYQYRRYDDVRLVFAPEDGIGFFGGDPDNYEYPRWNLDVSFLRVYEDGAPAKTPEHFAWSRGGAKDGELIFLAGQPGKTERGMTVAQLEEQRDHVLPEQLFLYAEQRGMLNELTRRSPETARVAQGKLFSIENYFKRLRGQRRLLVDPTFFAARQEEERKLRDQVAADPARARQYGEAWTGIARAVAARAGYRATYLLLEGGAYDTRLITPKGFDSKLFVWARTLARNAAERKKAPAARLRELQPGALPAVQKEVLSTAPVQPELEIATLTLSLTKLREELKPDHPLVKKLLARETPLELATRVVRGTRLADAAWRKQLWEGGTAPASDPMLALAEAVDGDARAVRRRHEDEFDSVLARNGELVARARFDVYGTSIYPDATFTLRLSYGVVRGLVEDGRKIAPFTTFGGLFARATGKAPFALPPRWVEARPRLDMSLPFNFVGTPDSVGGSSGSPVLNRAAEVVGIYFDQNVWGTASAFGYDEQRRRAVMLSSVAIVHALEKVYRADALVKELRGK